MDLHQHHAFVSFHMADLTTLPEVYAAPLVSKVPLQTLRTHKVRWGCLVWGTTLLLLLLARGLAEADGHAFAAGAGANAVMWYSGFGLEVLSGVLH